MIKPNKWNKFKDKYSYMYDSGLFEHLAQRSRADVENGIFQLYYNASSKEPINPTETRNNIIKAFKVHFGFKKYICVVSKSRGLHNNGMFKHNVQLYFRVQELPSVDKMAEVDRIINECTVEALFRKLCKDGEVEFYTFRQLPGNISEINRIFKMCNGEIKPSIIQGGKWSYA